MVKGLNLHLSTAFPVYALTDFKQCVIDECYAIVTSVIAKTYTLQLFQCNNFVITIFF